MPEQPVLLEFVWLPTFEATAQGLLDDESQRELEVALVENPGRGAVMPRTGGFRKMRWRAKAKGTTGGARIVYYYVPDRETIYMVLAYSKGDRDDLTEAQRAELKALARLIKKGRG